jgi:uncharacterized protein (TIGR00369 family)
VSALDPAIRVRIEESFAAQSLMETLGARLADITPGRIVIEAPILPGSLQQQGFGHAGLTFSIGDSAAGYSALSLMPADQEVLTVEMKINLLAPAAGDFLRATGRVVKAGRRLSVVAADVHAITEGRAKLIAVLQGTMVPVAI